MAFERPLKIREVIENIHKRKYFLPAIQREFVWSTGQIEKLFDSLMRDYPVGSFLFWDVTKERIKDYRFYEFIQNYHERDNTHNPKANLSGESDIIAILDGQQRLTSLYLGLKGTYAYKLPRKRWDSDDAFPERKLYLNLTEKSDDDDLEYNFKFLSSDEVEKDSGQWFRVGKILDLREEYEVNKYLIDKRLLSGDDERAHFANRTLFKLHAIVHRNEIINYYLEKDKQLDKVLNIFIRVNSGGTFLSYSDLLLSIATAQWKNRDARDAITKFVDDLNNIGDGFKFDKDFVLKSCLVLNDFPKIAFKVDNFNRENMLKIETMWDDITESLKLAVNLVFSLGYTEQTLTSNNAIIPIAYYLLKRGSPYNFVDSSAYKEDRARIQKWLIRSLLKRAFSGQPDNVLGPIRRIISNNSGCFPLDEIIDRFRGHTKSLIFTDDDIENLFYYKYKQGYTFSTLALIYPTLDFRNKFHVDHIFPKSLFTNKKLMELGIDRKKIQFYLDSYDSVANLQLIEGVTNLEKNNQDFEKWLFSTCPNPVERNEYLRKHFIPDTELSIKNFDSFILERKKLLRKAFESILDVTEQDIELESISNGQSFTSNYSGNADISSNEDSYESSQNQLKQQIGFLKKKTSHEPKHISISRKRRMGHRTGTALWFTREGTMANLYCKALLEAGLRGLSMAEAQRASWNPKNYSFNETSSRLIQEGFIIRKAGRYYVTEKGIFASKNVIDTQSRFGTISQSDSDKQMGKQRSDEMPMLKVISDKNRIAKAAAMFKTSLIFYDYHLIDTNIGYQSGSVRDRVYWFPELQIWGLWRLPPSPEEAAKKYWNAFGIGEPRTNVSIVCEMNPPLEGIDRRISSAFAEDSSGKTYILHRGRFNTAGGMTMAFFERHYAMPYSLVEEGKSISKFISIGPFNQPDFGNKLSEFVFEVDRIKNLARGNL